MSDPFSKFEVNGIDLDFRYARHYPYRAEECNDIGIPGTPGFGVGVCLEEDLPPCLTPMDGCYNPLDENYGNYIDTDGSQMVYIPKFYTKIVGGTVVDISSVPAAGYALERAFVEGANVWGWTGAANAGRLSQANAPNPAYYIRKGIFVDKCHCTLDAETSKFIAVPGAVPLTHGEVPTISGVANNGHSGFYIMAMSFRDGFTGNTINGPLAAEWAAKQYVSHLMPAWVRGALVRLAMCHSAASPKDDDVDIRICAWNIAPYSVGGNISAGTDTSRTWPVGGGVLTFTSVGVGKIGYVQGASRAGACVQGNEYTSHNGQKCGVLDMAGNYFEYCGGVSVTNGQDHYDHTIHVEFVHNSYKRARGDAIRWDLGYDADVANTPGCHTINGTGESGINAITNFPTFSAAVGSDEWLLWTAPIMKFDGDVTTLFGDDCVFVPPSDWLDGLLVYGNCHWSWTNKDIDTLGMHAMLNWHRASNVPWAWTHVNYDIAYPNAYDHLVARCVRYPNGTAAK